MRVSIGATGEEARKQTAEVDATEVVVEEAAEPIEELEEDSYPFLTLDRVYCVTC